MKTRFAVRKAALAAVLTIAAASAFAADDSANDARIKADVMGRIADGPDISGEIGVQSRDGIVTLSGYTTTLAEESRAVRLAEGVDGVKEVRNDMRAQVGQVL